MFFQRLKAHRSEGVSCDVMLCEQSAPANTSDKPILLLTLPTTEDTDSNQTNK